MCRHLDEQLRQLRVDNRFLALLFAVVDGERRAVTLGNAGVPRPFLLRDGRVERVGEHGIALGLKPLAGRAAATVLELRPGDVLLLSPSGELFGRDRIAALLGERGGASAQAIADAVLARPAGSRSTTPA